VRVAGLLIGRDERTERGTAVLVAGLDCYVVCNVFVFIVLSAIFQDGKRVVTSCVSLRSLAEISLF
jgi:hypothetical protein